MAELAAEPSTELAPGVERNVSDLKDVRANQDAFLDAYARLGTITAAAKAVRISRSCHTKWMTGTRGSEADYEQRFREAHDRYCDRIRGKFNEILELPAEKHQLHPVALIALARSRMQEFAAPEVAVQINNQSITLADV